jgi:hypothetical protein
MEQAAQPDPAFSRLSDRERWRISRRSHLFIEGYFLDFAAFYSSI